MFTTGLFVVLLLLVAFSIVSTYFLWPVPILSYCQGTLEERGTVVEINKIRPGVTEVGINHNVHIDPKLQEGNLTVTNVTYTSFVYFRGNKQIPRIGDPIKVTSVNRLYHFVDRSYDWVSSWEVHEGALPIEGRVSVIVCENL